MTPRVVLTVERATKRRADAEDRVATARDAQTDAIREALEAGVSAQSLATITGLSAARIYQIKAGS